MALKPTLRLRSFGNRMASSTACFMKPSSWDMQLGLASAGTYSSQSDQTKSPSKKETGLDASHHIRVSPEGGSDLDTGDLRLAQGSDKYFSGAAISRVQASTFLEPETARKDKWSIGGQATTEAEASEKTAFQGGGCSTSVSRLNRVWGAFVLTLAMFSYVEARPKSAWSAA